MSRIRLAAVAWCVVLLLAPAAAANPFGLKEAPAPAGNPFGLKEAPVPVSPPAPPGPVRRVMQRLNEAQRALNAMVSRQMRAIGETGSPGAVLAVGLIAFLYGVLHAAGPGHGKLVISSFFLAQDARWARGVMVGGFISLLQALSSIAIVWLLAVFLDQAGFDVLNRSTWVEVVSYGLVVMVGLVMLVGVATGRHLHAHHAHHEPAAGPGGRRVGVGLILAAGLTPCASAIILLLFALANGVFAIGIAAALVMAVGMGLTVSVVGVATILTRRALVQTIGARPRAARWTANGLAVAGASLITLVGALFFASAWSRLH